MSQNWETVYELDKELVDKQWEEFMRIFMDNFNIIFPFKKNPFRNFNKTKYKQQLPEILECKTQLDTLYMLKDLNKTFRVYYSTEKERI